jgi:pyruvate-ferredoxin/flavodoxin oxidoreductase
MGNGRVVTIDGNEAAAYVAHKLSEVIAIYPITPSSTMGEWTDQWSAEMRVNLWGQVPHVIEMQSEGGAAGAVHGALQAGSLATTFTSSQGLLLMIPNLYKIAGELTPTVFHVAARAVATHALSIFGDHSDVMAARSTGFALLSANSVQEVHDFALIAHAATLQTRVPFIHFFDGFRTSHEITKIELLDDETMRSIVDQRMVAAHRTRALSPDKPVMRGTAQNPDVFFQGREAANSYYLACPSTVQEQMDHFARLTGRQYHLFDYVGAPDAERVLVLMGSGAETVQATIEEMVANEERVGLIKVRLFRPFSVEQFARALPASVRCIGVLDRTKEHGSAGEPLYQDIVTAVNEVAVSSIVPFAGQPRVIGGRYGLGSKEFTPAMVRAVFDELAKMSPRNHFTVGIVDDMTHASLAIDDSYSLEDGRGGRGDSMVRAIFYGLGSDGTVGANKNAIKIIGESTDNHAQGYFVYDSKKSGSVTISHLRFGPRPIHAPYLIRSATFVACHQFSLLDRYDVLEAAESGATFLLNSSFGAEELWDHLPRRVQSQILDKKLRLYSIDADRLARDAQLGGRINTVMQTCFFAISNVMPREEAIAAIKDAIAKTYGKRGEAVVQKNIEVVDRALDHLREIAVPKEVTSTTEPRPAVSANAPSFVRQVTAAMIAGQGDTLPVSALPVDGTYPTGTSQWEKRCIADEVPIWDPDICIQCGKCSLVCPHAAIRQKVYDPSNLAGAPSTFASMPARWREFPGYQYTLQVAPEDCTGCGICVEACPVKNKRETRLKAINLAPLESVLVAERENFAFFLELPEADRRKLHVTAVKDNQLLQPLFEFSGACAGCGETPYLKLLSQLFGDRALIANATGCSSIYGGNLPTTPWARNREGRGPAWSNSLFEDNAEFGLGFRLALDQQAEAARALLVDLRDVLGADVTDALLETDQSSEEGIAQQRQNVRNLKGILATCDRTAARELASIADGLVRRSVWLVGGDGWAYDIGYGGLDHVLASGRDVNVLVLDTEVYSNTGGQMSKATPRGAVAKFASAGKSSPKKDLGLLAMTYGNVYVARIAMGANDAQTARAFVEAEAYRGPSLIIAYSHCIAHGYDLRLGLDQQKKAVASGYWPLFRFNPELAQRGEAAFLLDSKPPELPLETYLYAEARFRVLLQTDPTRADTMLRLIKEDVQNRWQTYEHLASRSYPQRQTFASARADGSENQDAPNLTGAPAGN